MGWLSTRICGGHRCNNGQLWFVLAIDLRGDGGRGTGTVTRLTDVSEQAGRPAAGHSYAATRRHGGVRPRPGGLNHILDRAQAWGVMPISELASWPCPAFFTPPGPGNGPLRP